MCYMNKNSICKKLVNIEKMKYRYLIKEYIVLLIIYIYIYIYIKYLLCIFIDQNY